MGQQDAIRKDGSNDGGNEQQTSEQEPVLSERELAMQQIDEQLANAPKPQVVGQGSDNLEPEQQLPTETNEPKDEKKEPLKVRVKVDGVEQELPIDEVIKGYQKDAAASRRLQQAAEKERELDRQRAELEQLRAQMQSAQSGDKPSGETADDDSDADDIDRQIEEAVSAMSVGDDEKAVDLMKALIKGRGKATATQQVDIDDLKQTLKLELQQEKVASDREQVFESFLEKYPEFADTKSPQRKYGDYLFQTTYGPKIEAGEISYQEALTAAADEAQRIYGPRAADHGDTATQDSTRSAKLERKKAIDNVPVAGGRAVKAAQTPETVDDTITEMRKARGQVV